MKYHGFVAVALFLLLVGCQSSESSSNGDLERSAKQAEKLDQVTLLLNWLPEAEHGGYYAALVHGIYEEFGLDVTIRPGGQTVMVAPELAIGRVEFGIGNADDVLISQNEGTAMVALMAPLQNGPRCIMVREDSGIESFEQLKNVTLQINAGRPYIPFLRSKGLLDESVKIVPYNGTVAQLVAGPGFAQQAYSFSEPLLAEKEGVAVRTLMMSEIGYNPYACCLVAEANYIANHPDIVRRMVKASILGWEKYLEDPSETNVRILADNKLGMTQVALEYGVEKLRPLCEPGEENCGMSQQRWKELHSQLIDLEMIDGQNVDVNACFSLEFLSEE